MISSNSSLSRVRRISLLLLVAVALLPSSCRYCPGAEELSFCRVSLEMLKVPNTTASENVSVSSPLSMSSVKAISSGGTRSAVLLEAITAGKVTAMILFPAMSMTRAGANARKVVLVYKPSGCLATSLICSKSKMLAVTVTSVESTADTLVANVVRVYVSDGSVALGDTLNSSCEGSNVLTRTVSEKVRMICRGGTKLSMWIRKLTSSGLVISR